VPPRRRRAITRRAGSGGLGDGRCYWRSRTANEVARDAADVHVLNDNPQYAPHDHHRESRAAASAQRAVGTTGFRLVGSAADMAVVPELADAHDTTKDAGHPPAEATELPSYQRHPSQPRRQYYQSQYCP
jgi:hypothetical protein